MRGGAAFDRQSRRTVERAYRHVQMQFLSDQRCERAERYLAAGLDAREERAFRRGREPRGAIIEPRHPASGALIIRAHAHSYGSLRNCRRKLLNREMAGDVSLKSETLQAGGCENDRVIRAALQALDTRRDIAAQFERRKVRARVREKRPAPQTA